MADHYSRSFCDARLNCKQDGISQLLRERKNEKDMLLVVVVVIVGRVGKQRGSVATYATFIN